MIRDFAARSDEALLLRPEPERPPELWRLDRGRPDSDDSELPCDVVEPLRRIDSMRYCARAVCIFTCLAALQCSKHMSTRQKTTGT